MSEVLSETDIPDLNLFKRGKVRDVFHLSKVGLLVVTTDRVSAFDVVMKNGIPGKGKVLNQISSFWFKRTKEICHNHFIMELTKRLFDLPADDKIPILNELQLFRDQLEGRSMVVLKTKPFPIECVVRGYLLGSAWQSYQETGSVCGIELPRGLKKGDKLTEPIFTPATKEEAPGKHDENVTFEAMETALGPVQARLLRKVSINLYNFAAGYAQARGFIISDTKFEFGVDDEGQIILIDELLTPDSSRYVPDRSKQPLRDWLDSINFDRQTPVELPPEVVKQTSRHYLEACRMITGKGID